MRTYRLLTAAVITAVFATASVVAQAAAGPPAFTGRTPFTVKHADNNIVGYGFRIVRETEVLRVTGATSVSLTMMRSYNYKPFICKRSDPKCSFGPALLVAAYKGPLAFHQLSAGTWKLVTTDRRYLKTYTEENTYGGAIGWLYTVTARNAFGTTSYTFGYVTAEFPHPSGPPPPPQPAH
jgi:hypothetical protein